MIVLIFIIVNLSILSANAQAVPKYLLDGSNVIWFVQITDTHVDSDALKYYKEYFPWVLNEAVPIINPSFVVVTGDLTDSTKSTFPYYGFGPHEEEWLKYKEIYTSALMTPSFYYDCPGNHDSYGDGQLSYYLKYSMQGSFTNSTQASWYIDNGKGIYHFFYVATTPNDGKQWPYDNQEFTDEELIEVERFLRDNPNASIRIAFAHHDYEKENVRNKDRFLVLLKHYGISYFGNGHEHDVGFRIGDGQIVKFRLDSLGQSEGNNVAIWAIDNFNVTIKVYKAMSMFPAALITAPADVLLDDPKGKLENPNIPPVSIHCNRAPVRALVFSRDETPEVSFKIDSGSEIKMIKRKTNPYQYRGYFDATNLKIGLHTITVIVKSDIVRETKNEFYVSDVPCELGNEDDDEIVISDAGIEILEDISIGDNLFEDDPDEDRDSYKEDNEFSDDFHYVNDISVIDTVDVKMVDVLSIKDVYVTDITINKPDIESKVTDSESIGCSCNFIH
ncbi:MAG: metallophosphoesterase [Deltaproteobacteria bacterium]|nr:metallophosphoesterase [Deltaproteobacteria bacterium]